MQKFAKTSSSDAPPPPAASSFRREFPRWIACSLPAALFWSAASFFSSFCTSLTSTFPPLLSSPMDDAMASYAAIFSWSLHDAPAPMVRTTKIKTHSELRNPGGPYR